MKKHLPLLVVALSGCAAVLAPSASAASVLLDFGTSSGSASGATAFANTSAGQTATLGTDTLTFAFTNFTTSGSSGHAGSFSPGTFATAADDYFFVRGTGSAGLTGTITISGFTGSAYSFSLASSVNGFADAPNNDRLADIRVNGAFADSGGDPTAFGDDYSAKPHGFDTGIPLVWSNITPVAGVITLTIQTPAGDPAGFATDFVGYANALQISEVPEPSGLLLGTLGALGLFLCRRR